MNDRRTVWLEKWIAAARDEGIRALDQLRDGVEAALTELGSGFLSHPNNTQLRKMVAEEDLNARGMYRYLLRLVYRLLFLFVAEDRDLLLVPDTGPDARHKYDRFYSTSRIRELASRPTTPGHIDLWAGLAVLMNILGKDEGEPALGLPGLGSFLWDFDAIGSLIDSDIDNDRLLEAIRSLAYVREAGTMRRIDFAALGAEELGSVYESLLELHPAIDQEDRAFSLGEGAGSERKTTGSYYTPTELISELLDSALDPVVEEAASKDDPEKAILDLKVVDPAAGSGHFLVAAAHRIAKRLAEVRTGEPEPPEDRYRTAIRDVVSRCLYAVDINDLAVELCKVSLWLEALEPSKPLSFLDHHILHGNSLFGATPAAIAEGIPNEAFAALTGDDKEVVSALKKRNREERGGQEELIFDPGEVVSEELKALEGFDDTDLETVRVKEKMLASWKASPEYEHARLVADAWCAAFAIEKTPDAPQLTEGVFRRLRDDGVVGSELRDEIERLAEQHGYFHWHLGFPQVFHVDDESSQQLPGWSGGFDVVLGNPPWEKIEFSEREWFSSISPEIASASGTERKAMIRRLETKEPATWLEYRRHMRLPEVERTFLTSSGGYVLTGRGKVNTYAVFAELMRRLATGSGRVGVITPTGIATDDTSRHFFADIVDTWSLVSLFDFENRRPIFAGVHRSYRFCLLTLSGSDRPVDRAEFVFSALGIGELRDPERRFSLSQSDFALLNPLTRTCPIFKTRRDAEITKAVYAGAKPFVESWDPTTLGGMNVGDDASILATEPDQSDGGWLRYLESKMIWLYDHRYADVLDPAATKTRALTDWDHHDPDREAEPRYWVRRRDFYPFMEGKWEAKWYLVWRDVTNATNERTLVPALIPDVAFARNNLPGFRVAGDRVELAPFLITALSSMLLDYIARQKISGSHLTRISLLQLPVIDEGAITRFPAHVGLTLDWFRRRAAELIFTATSLIPAGIDLALGEVPYVWDPVRRPRIIAELDAAFFHLYGIERNDVDYIMEAFPIVKRNDTREHGSYRSKELVFEVYDRMAHAIETGEPYQTILDPPPADPSLRVDIEEAK